jgi:hypothetical protein
MGREVSVAPKPLPRPPLPVKKIPSADSVVKKIPLPSQPKK